MSIELIDEQSDIAGVGGLGGAVFGNRGAPLRSTYEVELFIAR